MTDGAKSTPVEGNSLLDPHKYIDVIDQGQPPWFFVAKNHKK